MHLESTFRIEYPFSSDLFLSWTTLLLTRLKTDSKLRDVLYTSDCTVGTAMTLGSSSFSSSRIEGQGETRCGRAHGLHVDLHVDCAFHARGSFLSRSEMLLWAIFYLMVTCKCLAKLSNNVDMSYFRAESSPIILLCYIVKEYCISQNIGRIGRWLVTFPPFLSPFCSRSPSLNSFRQSACCLWHVTLKLQEVNLA